MIESVKIGLHRKEALRVADMALEGVRHLREIFEEPGEDPVVCRNHRVLSVYDIIIQISVVGINNHFHTISDVIEPFPPDRGNIIRF